jgi:hypothetical protein
MKTIRCAFCRKKKYGRRKNRIEVVAFTKSTEKTTAPRRRPNFPFDYNENEALVIRESLNEGERRG